MMTKANKDVRVEMTGDYSYSPDGINTIDCLKDEIVDLPERQFSIAKGKGVAKKAAAGAKTDAEKAGEKAGAVQEKLDLEAVGAQDEALQEIIDEHATVVEGKDEEIAELSKKVVGLTDGYNALMALARPHVPKEEFDSFVKASEKEKGFFGEFFKKLLKG